MQLISTIFLIFPSDILIWIFFDNSSASSTVFEVDLIRTTTYVFWISRKGGRKRWVTNCTPSCHKSWEVNYSVCPNRKDDVISSGLRIDHTRFAHSSRTENRPFPPNCNQCEGNHELTVRPILIEYDFLKNNNDLFVYSKLWILSCTWCLLEEVWFHFLSIVGILCANGCVDGGD